MSSGARRPEASHAKKVLPTTLARKAQHTSYERACVRSPAIFRLGALALTATRRTLRNHGADYAQRWPDGGIYTSNPCRIQVRRRAGRLRILDDETTPRGESNARRVQDAKRADFVDWMAKQYDARRMLLLHTIGPLARYIAAHLRRYRRQTRSRLCICQYWSFSRSRRDAIAALCF